jgi:tRNA G18 (ribose-2'-O)-methylase SpoU
MKKRIRTTPDLAANSIKHIDAAANLDAHHRKWQRNVIDEFKSLEDAEIRAKLKATTFPYAVLCENWHGEYNISSCMRNANAFNAEAFYYIGDKRFDARGALGVHNYTDINFISNIEDLTKLKESYTFVAADNVAGSVPLKSYVWPKRPLIFFGSEGTGLTPAALAMCKDVVYIEQFGSVRSLNAATASGIIMNDFVSKHLNAKHI